MKFSLLHGMRLHFTAAEIPSPRRSNVFRFDRYRANGAAAMPCHALQYREVGPIFSALSAYIKG
jgi:hypothetical protein